MACQGAAARAAPGVGTCSSPAASVQQPCCWPQHNRPHRQQQEQHRSGRNALCKAATGAGGTTTVPVHTTAQPADCAAPRATDIWASFAENVSGEWDGVMASFGPNGSALPLPQYYVPQAYRDWGVELFDWQSQSSMLGNAEGLTATNRRMMPTVGCEADAIAYTQDTCQLFQAGAGVSAALTVAPDGSYSHSPLNVSPADCFKAALEQCLVMEPRQRRLRVVHNLRRAGAEEPWQLDSVELHQERYNSPYHGKLELSGCGGGMRAFATDERLAAEAVLGVWTASGVRYSLGGSSGECRCEAVRGESWSADSLAVGSVLLHPLRAWSSCDIQREDISVAAGVLLGDGGSSMAVATRRLVAGQLVAAELLTLTRA